MKLPPIVDHLAQLPAAFRRLRGYLHPVAKPAGPADAPPDPGATQETAPLSWSQERMLFLDQMQAEAVPNNVASTLRLRGPLDVAALGAAIDEVVRRHEPLRTVYRLSADQPVQVVRPAAPLQLRPETVPMDGERQREAYVDAWCRRLAGATCDLAEGPVFRAGLLRLDPTHHVLMLVVHHIACDGVSMNLLLRELAQVYVAFRNGRTSPLPELPLGYSDYARQQRRSLDNRAQQGLVSYWTNRLKGAPGLLDLPLDRPRPAIQRYLGARHEVTLAPELSDAIDRSARQNGTTAFTLALAAFQLLLGRLAARTDVVVGVPFAGRTRIDTEALIGLFLNVLVMRTDLSQARTFRELLAQVRDHALDAYDHHDLPFERLVEVMRPERSLAYSPLVQVLFNGAPVDSTEWTGSGLSVEQIAKTEAPSKFDLTVYFRRSTGRIDLAAVWNPELFDDRRMRELLAQYQHLLAQVVERSDQPLGSLDLITEGSRTHLPNPGSTLMAVPQRPLLDQLRDVVHAMPDGIAIDRGGKTWRYDALWHAIESAAAGLRQQGIGTGMPVAVTGRPSFGLICSILGVMRAGAVVIPIDPGQPPLRQRLLIEQAGCVALMVVGELDPGAGEPVTGRMVLRVDEHSGAITPVNAPDAGRSGSGVRFPEEAAYVFYTSGTTGVPKGVVGRHASLGHFINWQRDQFDVGPSDRVAQVTGLSFDVIMREIFLPLTSGARLCIPDVRVDDPAELFPWLDRQGVTILHGVPSRLRNWLGPMPDRPRLQRLRWLFMSGEPLTDSLVRDWRTQSAGAVVNLYGPTETTLVKSWYPVPEGDRLEAGVQCIGSPLPQTQLLILREGLHHCGVGEAGEIVIRTPFRTLGYLDPSQTRERFRPNPFTTDPDDLLYFTGDLGRYRPDGTIAIAGRLDDQVKIGGVRIEPAEVAGMLAGHPDLAACHVGAVGDSNAEKRLVAWVVPRSGAVIEEAVLRGFLRARLPALMIPARFVSLAALPLTSNGKVDRHSLPLPPEAGAGERTGHVAPRTETERTLALIWSQVLERSGIGIDDDFFEIGGHSLMAARIQTRIRSTFGIAIPLRALFDARTIAELASRIEAAST